MFLLFSILGFIGTAVVTLSRSLLDDFPTIDFTINGGISSYAEMKTLLDRESLSRSSDLMHSERLHRKVKGVMIGRMVMRNPYLLRHIDKCFYGVPDPGLSRRQIVEKYVDYVDHFLATHRNADEHG